MYDVCKTSFKHFANRYAIVNKGTQGRQSMGQAYVGQC